MARTAFDRCLSAAGWRRAGETSSFERRDAGPVAGPRRPDTDMEGMMGHTARMTRPTPREYAPYYADYVNRAAEAGDDALELLERGRDQLLALLGPIGDVAAAHRYREGKWSVKEVLGHLVDTERVFATRALAFARKDPAELPGFEQDEYVAAAGFDARSLGSLLQEYTAVRGSTRALYLGLGPDAWRRRGIANGVEFTVRATAWIVAGHERHHMWMLRSRYLTG